MIGSSVKKKVTLLTGNYSFKSFSRAGEFLFDSQRMCGARLTGVKL
jgi:hypothetical protein